jgi:hypothetical protein
VDNVSRLVNTFQSLVKKVESNKRNKYRIHLPAMTAIPLWTGSFLKFWLLPASLDRRFGRPEQIVLRVVTAIRALPRVTGDLKDLATFAARVRNCAEVVKLLNETDYLGSPELFSALINKLHPLLRTRWPEYAAAQASAAAPSSRAKVELLYQFLSREVDLHIKFDSPADAPHVQRQRTHATSESEPGLRKYSDTGNKSKNMKKYQSIV